MSVAGPAPHLVVVARDAAATRENQALVELVQALVDAEGAPVTVVLQHGGPLVDDLAASASVRLVDALSRRSPGSVAERLLGRIGLRATAARVRGRRLGLGRLGSGDVVYLHTVLVVQVLRYLPPGVPVLCRVPEAAHPLRQPLSVDDLGLLLDRVTRFLPVTAAGADELTRVHGIAPDRVVRAHEAVAAHVDGRFDRAEEARALRDGLGLPEDVVVVGMFGAAAVEIHAPAAPLAVAIRRRPDGKDVVLLLVVPEHMADPWATHDIANAGLSDSVAVVEAADPARTYVELCDLVVHAGWGSDHPLAYLEAAAAGVAIVCAEGHDLADVVGDDEGGFVCPRLDLPALAERVTTLAADPALRRAMGARAAERVVERHGAAAAAARLWDQARAVAS